MFKEGYFEPREYNLIYDQLASIANLSESLPDFPGRLRLAHLFDFLAHLMYTGKTKGTPAMSNAIGNRKLSLLRRAVPDAVKPGYLLREHSGGGSRDFVIRREPN